VYLHGTVRNEKGQRMSKSLGTGVDPLELVDQYGADALRYTLITSSGPGNDMKLSAQRVEAGRNFANKLWNAARFVLTSIGDERVEMPASPAGPAAPLEDRWIVSRVEGLARSVDVLLRNFELGEAGRQVYEFAWNEFADWYIEIAKVRMRTPGAASPLPVLAYVLDRCLRLLHPYMPFVTEEIWQALAAKVDGLREDALIVAAYPRGESTYADEEAEREIDTLISVVRSVRNIRAEKKVEPARMVEAYVAAAESRAVIESCAAYIETLARARPLHVVDSVAGAPREQVATAVLAGVTVVVPLAGLFDLDAERARLTKLMADVEADARRIEGKLADERFRTRAPAQIVSTEEQRLAAARERLEGLRASLAELG
jgi:valyl-tRNA synthetase